MGKASGGKTSKYGKIDVHRIWFSDEKLFRIHPWKTCGSQNKRDWTFSDDDRALRLKEGERFSKGVMVPLAFSRSGKGRLFFAQEGSKICGQAYEPLLDYDVMPDINMHMATKGNTELWRWLQDWVPPRGRGDVRRLLPNKHMVPQVFKWIPKGESISSLDFSICA